MLKTLWEPGFFLLRGSESVTSFTSFHLFIDWSGTWWLLAWCWCCWFGVCCLCCFVLSVPGLSFWSSCPTMTTLAQLHDCHCCNDERSIVQKKEAVVLLRLHLPPFFGEGAIYCPRRLCKRDLVALLGLQIPCAENGDECMCFVNNVELTNARNSQVEDGGFIWCLHASPDMGREIEILSVASPSLTSVEEDAGPALPSLAAPQDS